jgi:uncharacterized phage-associated protein
MDMRFDEGKATQAAAYMLSLSPNGRMHYFHLIKLLYLADRAALLQRGIPVTTDHYAAMEHGPIVSAIYDLIKKPPKSDSVWAYYISKPSTFKRIGLLKRAPKDKLSRAEEKVMKNVFDQYGHWNRYKLRDFVMHKLPEWKSPPGNTSIPITVADILRAEGEGEDDIGAIQSELKLFGDEEGKFCKVAR